jgi:hypothetical protein
MTIVYVPSDELGKLLDNWKLWAGKDLEWGSVGLFETIKPSEFP